MRKDCVLSLVHHLSKLLTPAIGAEVYARPIEVLRADHERQRCFCEELSALVDDMFQSGREKLAASLLRFLVFDVSLNMEDEEELLEPLLRRRSMPHDHLPAMIRSLHNDHNATARLAGEISDGLDRLAAGHLPATPLDFIISSLTLVDKITRHVDWEDNNFLPLARSRLTSRDKAALGRAMARHRGVSRPLLN